MQPLNQSVQGLVQGFDGNLLKIKKAYSDENCKPLILLVGTVRFELTTPWTPSKCATRLRYAPKCNIIAVFFYKANQLPL